MLTELTRNAPVEPTPAVVPEKPVETAKPEPEAKEVDDRPEPMVARDQADTAMLLRELSSLGFGLDDGPEESSGPAAPRSAPPPGADKKKRKGLFGRG